MKLALNWRALRKAEVPARRELLAAALQAAGDTCPPLAMTGLAMSGPDSANLELAEVMIENAIGMMPVPLGLAGGFLIDGSETALPMATEEPSVIAAASFAATIIARQGGFTTWAAEPSMIAQIFLQPAPGVKADPALPARVLAAEASIKAALEPTLDGMIRRGGGYRGLDASWLDADSEANQPPILRVQLHIDTRDAMGANLLNTCAERLRPLMERVTGLEVLMAILSNASPGRLAGARCAIPLDELSRGGYHGQALAERMVTAALIADRDASRAVTHNKGIMNGITALALATGNDTRAIEAAAHAWAARDGAYRSLSRWWIADGSLHGLLELPLPFATVGGAVGCHPTSQLNLALAGIESATGLSRAAAALGLAQNFAALQALVSEGIQAGHMKLHARREAWKAGLLASFPAEKQP